MQKFDFALWLPVFALFLGAILHSLSADGGASVLDHFGIQARIPPIALPIAVLVFGFGSGVADNLIARQDLQHALATAAAATVAGVFGATAHHAVANGKAGPTIMIVGFSLALMSGSTGCAAFLHQAEVIAADAAKCLVEHQDMPDDQAFVFCGVAEAEKIIAKEILQNARRESAKHAVAAAAIAEEKAKRRLACKP